MTASKILLLAVGSGGLLAAGYEPFNLWWLAYVALIPLMRMGLSAPTLQVVGLFSLTGSLLAISVFYGIIGYGFFALLLIAMAYALAFALWGWLISWMYKRHPGMVSAVIAPAFLWVGIETLAGSTVLGIPIYLGLSQANQPGLLPLASWFGISSISFLIILVNAILSWVLMPGRLKQRETIYSLAGMLLILFLVIGFGEMRVDSPTSTVAKIQVATVQPVIDSDIYRYGWQQPENRQFMHSTLRTLTRQAAEDNVQMIFWPEGGNGYMNLRVPDLRGELSSMAIHHEVDLIVSSRDMDTDGRYFNSVFSIAPTGQVQGRYDKRQLLPFAEADLTSGSVTAPLPTRFGALGTAICFESVFPEALRKMTMEGANILFVTSSDASFKRSSLALHHAGLAIFRAVENGRWLVRAANTGPSLIISPRGEVMASTEFYRRGVLMGEVEARNELTFFTRVGHWLPKALSLLVIGLAMYSFWSRFYRSRLAVRSADIRQWVILLPLRARSALQVIVSLGVVMMSTFFVFMFVSLYLVNPTQAGVKNVVGLATELVMPELPAIKEVSSERFMQSGDNTCGAAVLAYVMSFLGRETREDEIVRMVSIGERGTSMLELKQAVEKLEFEAFGVSENYAALREEVLPLIAYINDSHYVVVTQVDAREVHMFDPALGEIRLSRRDFERAWNGYLLLIRPRPIDDLEKIAMNR